MNSRSMVSAVYGGRAVTAEQAEKNAARRRAKSDQAASGRREWSESRHQTECARMRSTMVRI